MDFEGYDIIRHGRILEFDEVTQRATVRVCSEKTAATKLETESSAGLIDIRDVPVHVSSGGGWAITMSFKKGDTCVLFFSQSGYDHWLYDDLDSAGRTLDGSLPYWTKRTFSEADGFCLGGFNTEPRAIQNYSTDGSQWRNVDATQSIHLKADRTIEINTTANVNVNCQEAKVTATKTTVEGEAFITGDVHMSQNLVVDGDITCVKKVSASGVTSSGGVSGATMTVGGKDVGSHTHTSAGSGGTSSPPN